MRFACPGPSKNRPSTFAVLLAALSGVALSVGACGARTGAPEPAQVQPAGSGGTRAYSPATLTVEDYADAERFLFQGVSGLVTHEVERPQWSDDGRLEYLTLTDAGRVRVVVDPEAGSREQVSQGGAGATGREAPGRPGDPQSRAMVVSPDGRLGAFTRGHNLWLQVLDTGEEVPLTTDGVEDYGYATNNAGWARSDRPVLRWSPDSRRIATFRHDARGVGEMYLASTKVGHPELDAWRYPLPEDSVIFRIERLIIDLGPEASSRASGAELDPELVWLAMAPDPHRSSVCDHVYCGGTFTDVDWSDDGSELAFVSSSRDHKRATLRVADAETGEVRTVLEEVVPTFYESGYQTYNWRFLPSSSEVIWFSRKSNWSHLYLHDLDTGSLKHPITEGDWNVLQVRRVDPESRTIWFTGNEREAGDPYFHYFYRVGLDDGSVTLLTPDSAHHDITLSPDGRYFLDQWSTPTTPPVAAIRDAWTGEVVMELERADASALLATGWRPPLPFTVKARDGVTDLYGLLYRPTDYDSAVAYPVVNYIYPGPQSGSVGDRSFSAARRDHQAMAELGFVVVALDAMGTPQRSRSFHEAYYGDMGDNGLPDQVAGIQELGERYPWMDLDRVGVWGHSGGGFASAGAIFRYPDFYKVAVSQAGNHDNRNYEDDWGEKWQGLLEERTGGGTSYDNQANQLVARNLQGKLLLAHGLVDDNVPPYNTLLVVQALIEANEDFDLIVFPESRHGFAMHPYMIRRRWDYFVENLLGADPPAEYTIGEGGR